ncbi:MAG: type II toxin-antitoxin system HicB family antitoxin [Methanosarcinales archaeon]
MMQVLKNEVFHLDVIIEAEDDLFTAHCLQFDIVSDGRTIEEAKEMIIDAILEYLTFAIENDLLDEVYKPAPIEYWQKLSKINRKKERYIGEESKLKHFIPEIDFLSELDTEEGTANV